MKPRSTLAAIARAAGGDWADSVEAQVRWSRTLYAPAVSRAGDGDGRTVAEAMALREWSSPVSKGDPPMSAAAHAFFDPA